MNPSAVKTTPFCVKDLVLGIRNLSMVVIVLDVGEPRTTKEGHEVRTVLVADKTGSVNLTVWDGLGGLLQPSDILQLNKAYVKHFKGYLSLCIPKEDGLTKIGEFCFLFSEVPNMSEHKLVDLIPPLFGVAESATTPELRSPSSSAETTSGGDQSFKNVKEWAMSTQDNKGQERFRTKPWGNQVAMPAAFRRSQDGERRQGPGGAIRPGHSRKRLGSGSSSGSQKGQNRQGNSTGYAVRGMGFGRGLQPRGAHRGHWKGNNQGQGAQNRPFNHTATSGGNKPFSCTQCGARFTSKEFFKNHIKTFHKKVFMNKEQKHHWKSVANQRKS